MKIESNQVQRLAEASPPSFFAKTQAPLFQSTIASGTCSPVLETVKELGRIVYRLITFFLNMKAPSFTVFIIPEMTTERFDECRSLITAIEGRQWSTANPMWKPGPSQRQKATLVHQFSSYYDHLRDLGRKEKARTQGAVTIHLKGQEKSIRLEIDPSKDREFYVKELLTFISNPEFHERWKESIITLSFKTKCSVDKGTGPIYFHFSTLLQRTTCHADKNYSGVTTEPILKLSGTSRYFSPQAVAQAHESPGLL